MAQGVDRGVVQPFTLADGSVFDFSEAQKRSLLKAEIQARRWQRKASNRVKGSNNQKKAYARVARYKSKQQEIRQDFAHKTSHALVSLQDIWLIVFEKENLVEKYRELYVEIQSLFFSKDQQTNPVPTIIPPELVC